MTSYFPRPIHTIRGQWEVALMYHAAPSLVSSKRLITLQGLITSRLAPKGPLCDPLQSEVPVPFVIVGASAWSQGATFTSLDAGTSVSSSGTLAGYWLKCQDPSCPKRASVYHTNQLQAVEMQHPSHTCILNWSRANTLQGGDIFLGVLISP